MPNAKTLTLEEVAGLGPERLAALLLEAAEYDPALMRSVRFAVASRIDAAAAAAEIDQQIRSFRRSTAFVDHRQRMAFARDLGALVDAIAGPLADLDPAGALARMLDFIALTPSIFERSDDDGTIGDQFQAACVAVATLIERTPPVRRSRTWCGEDMRSTSPTITASPMVSSPPSPRASTRSGVPR